MFLCRCAAVALVWCLSATASVTLAAQQALKPVGDEWAQELSFSLDNLAGEKRALEDFAGKVLLVNFWATWCRPCVKELPSIEEVKDRLGSDVFDVVAINVGEDIGQIEEFLSKRLGGPLALEVLLDENLVAAKSWKVRAVPTTYIVDKKGKIKFVATGEADFSHEDVVKTIQSLIVID